MQGIAAALQTSPVRGLDTQTAHADQTLQGRQRVFGANKFKEVQQKAFFQLVFENLQDPILILLIVAALVSDCMTGVLQVGLLGSASRGSWPGALAQATQDWAAAGTAAAILYLMSCWQPCCDRLL